MNLKDIRSELFQLLDEFYNQKKDEDFIPGKTKIHYAKALFNQNEVKAVLSTLLDGWLVIGRQTKKFEVLFAKFIGSKGCITTNSGSSALILAWACLKNHRLKNHLKNGDEVITTAMAHPATINCLLHNRLKPVLVDIDFTYTIDPSLAEKAVSRRVRGILPLHFLGNPCDMERLCKISESHNLFMVEDCCNTHGAEFKDRKVGTFGDMGTFSFYPAHHITMGEGGAVVYNNSIYGTILRSLRAWGSACSSCPFVPCKIAQDPNYECPMRFKTISDALKNYDRRYLFVDIAYNLKIIEMQAAFGIEQLKRTPRLIKKRKENWEYIVKSLEDYNDYLITPKPTPKSEPSWFAVGLTVRPDAPFTRYDLIKWLEKHKIETRLFFAGNIIDQPAYKNIQFKVVGNLKNTKLVRDNAFFIGCYQGITKEMVEYIVNVFDDFFKKFR